MKSKLFSLLVFATLLVAASTSRAGITVYDPPNSRMGGYFTIYYGLGTPAPGKVAYVTVTKPNGSHFTVASAENVSDMSRVCNLYADIAGLYRFFYEYSFYSQGIPQTVVSEVDRYISANNAPQTTGISVNNTSPGQYTTIGGSAYDQDNNMQYLYFYVNPPNWSGWQFVGNAYAPGMWVSGSVGWTPAGSAMRGTWTAQVRALDSAGVWDWNNGVTAGVQVARQADQRPEDDVAVRITEISHLHPAMVVAAAPGCGSSALAARPTGRAPTASAPGRAAPCC